MKIINKTKTTQETETPIEVPAPGRALITGCAGMIGARVTELLLDQGWQLTGVDELNDSYDLRLKEWRLNRLLGRPGFEFHRMDIADAAQLRELFDGSDDNDGAAGRPFTAVINLAARAGVRRSVTEPEVYFRSNLDGTLNLLRACVDRAVPKFVLASSSSLYGGAGKDGLRFSEEMETSRSLSPYAASKKAAEVLAYTYHHLFNLDVTSLRYFTVYGPAGRPDMSLFRFVQKIIEGRPIDINGDGRQSRDFTFVDDVAQATLLALKPLGYEVINIGADAPVTVLESVANIEEVTGCKATINYRPGHPSDVAHTWADIDKAKRLLGWRPTITLREGIEQLVNWYRENRDWACEVATDDPPNRQEHKDAALSSKAASL